MDTGIKLKICDIAIMQMLDIKMNYDEQRESIIGINSLFLAPELSAGKVWNLQVSKKADIWSLGVIIYLLVTG